MTVAEWTLQGDQNLDYYDGTLLSSIESYVCSFQSLLFTVSLVDGSDLPMRIDNNVGCPVPDCPVDLGPTCEIFTEQMIDPWI